MSLQDLGSVGSLIGGISVTVSVVYLAVQIRQNTRAVRVASFHAVTDSFNRLNASIASSESLARIFRMGGEDLATLTDDERVRFGFLFLSAFRVFETLYYQNREGTGDPTLWDAEVRTIRVLLSAKGSRHWWDANPLSFTSAFRSFVDNEVLSKTPAAGPG